QSCDTRSMDGERDVGNAIYAGQEAMIIIDDVFVPWKYVFMCGETEFVPMLVERFTTYHRRSYVCKSGVGDVLIGAAASMADYNGVLDASHVREKLVEMAFLNEIVYGTGIASSYKARATKSGNYLNDEMLANVCKHHLTKFTFEIARLAQDLTGGIVATLPSEKDLKHPEIGSKLMKYLATREGVDPEHRVRMARLIENMTMGRNAVGYLSESLHGAGSPQAQRILIARYMNIEEKIRLAKRLAKIDNNTPASEQQKASISSSSTL
ncbi:MAG: 4-hydroxyphenylacetate 3-hydroxylase C-terminal domain-containing protein, partial [Candidatus Nitrosocaldus sp.]